MSSKDKIQDSMILLLHRLLAVPFWIVERALQIALQISRSERADPSRLFLRLFPFFPQSSLQSRRAADSSRSQLFCAPSRLSRKGLLAQTQ